MSNKTNDEILEGLALQYQEEVSKFNPDYAPLEDIKEQMRELGCPLTAEVEFEWLPAHKKEERMNAIMDKIEADLDEEKKRSYDDGYIAGTMLEEYDVQREKLIK